MPHVFDLEAVIDRLLLDLNPLRFARPVTHVYNPLEYARNAYGEYLTRYARSPEVMLVGMNPGPWGMAQTGIPFGDATAVRDWLKIDCPVDAPDRIHPKRPVQGLACPRREVSGQRLWGWAQKISQRADSFFDRFFVANYCPLMFIESSGRNRTPDKLKAAERKPLFAACDRALRGTVAALTPRFVVGIGRFARQRCEAALEGFPVVVGGIMHPSPANPQANRNWEERITQELTALGIATNVGV